MSPERGDGRTRTLHRNLLHLVNDLPADLPSPSIPEKERNLPGPKPLSASPPREKKREKRRLGRRRKGELAATSDSSESDENDNTSYWLRIRREPVSEPLRTMQEPEEAPVHTLLHNDTLHDMPDNAAFHPVLANEGEGLEEIMSEEEFRPIVSQSPSNQSGVMPSSGASQTDHNMSGHPTCVPQLDQSVDQGTATRKSIREKKPAQRLTYESLGEPSYQPQGRVNLLSAYGLPHVPVWEMHPHHIPYQPPYLTMPCQLVPCTSLMPYGAPMQVY